MHITTQQYHTSSSPLIDHQTLCRLSIFHHFPPLSNNARLLSIIPSFLSFLAVTLALLTGIALRKGLLLAKPLTLSNGLVLIGALFSNGLFARGASGIGCPYTGSNWNSICVGSGLNFTSLSSSP